MRLRPTLLCLAIAFLAGPSFAQTPPASSGPPEDISVPFIEAAPVMLPEQPTPSAQAQAGQPPIPATTSRTTLVPNPNDPTNVEEVVLPAKPAAVLTGTSPWDQAFDNLKSAFARIEQELTRSGIAPTGKPLTIFIHTDDQGFRYEAMIPIAMLPEGKTELTPEIKFGRTPEGKAFRFVHKESYEEIDGTYETIAAYLDAKDIVAKDAFTEEYVSEMTDPTDANLEVNIYVQPKE